MAILISLLAYISSSKLITNILTIKPEHNSNHNCTWYIQPLLPLQIHNIVHICTINHANHQLMPFITKTITLINLYCNQQQFHHPHNPIKIRSNPYLFVEMLETLLPKSLILSTNLAYLTLLENLTCCWKINSQPPSL